MLLPQDTIELVKNLTERVATLRQEAKAKHQQDMIQLQTDNENALVKSQKEYKELCEALKTNAEQTYRQMLANYEEMKVAVVEQNATAAAACMDQYVAKLHELTVAAVDCCWFLPTSML